MSIGACWDEVTIIADWVAQRRDWPHPIPGRVTIGKDGCHPIPDWVTIRKDWHRPIPDRVSIGKDWPHPIPDWVASIFD